MADGAHEGIGAGRALDTILGGDPEPSDDEKMSPEAFRDYISSAPAAGEAGGDYSDASRIMARIIWEHLSQHSEDADLELIELTDRVEATNPEWKVAVEGATGFMVGWAANAARACSKLPPMPNPALAII